MMQGMVQRGPNQGMMSGGMMQGMAQKNAPPPSDQDTKR
jgi:hypothetical protein